MTTDEIRDPLRVFITDKEYVKLYIKAIVGNQHSVPTVAILRDRKSVDNYDFPAHCCIKPTHLSGRVLFADGSIEINREILKRWMGLNYYRLTREVNYKTLVGKIIVEPLIFGQRGPIDYKFHCYDGQVKLISVTEGRHDGSGVLIRRYHDKEWKKYDFSLDTPVYEGEAEKPGNLREMIAVAEALSADFGYIRVDMYSDGNTCLVGELTNVSGRGCMRFFPPEAERQHSHLFFA